MLRYNIGASNNYGPKGHYWQLPQQLWPYLQGRPVYAYVEGTDVPASRPPSKGPARTRTSKCSARKRRPSSRATKKKKRAKKAVQPQTQIPLPTVKEDSPLDAPARRGPAPAQAAGRAAAISTIPRPAAVPAAAIRRKHVTNASTAYANATNHATSWISANAASRVPAATTNRFLKQS